MISITLNERLPGAESFAQQLREIGLHATIPVASKMAENEQSAEGISIGCSLPPDLVVAVLKAAFRQWPDLKYLRLTSDEKINVPESAHYQIRIGEAITIDDPSTTQAWTSEVIDRLDNKLSLTALHILLRTSYRNSVPATQIRYVGGPLDGEEHYYAGPPAELAPQLRSTMNAIYELATDGQRYEYHYASKKP